MKILVLGSGAREHALVRALQREQQPHEVLVAPGNPGIARDAAVVAVDPNSPDEVADFAIQHSVDLVVIGPEAPLVAGVADALRTRGIPVFGPGKAAAALEGSKGFAKRVMDAAGVPTGGAVQASTMQEVEQALDRFGEPYVVKADGLAGGKGVLVTDSREAALSHAESWLRHGAVLVEEFLAGEEVSLFLLSDGDTVRPLIPAQDFKRVGDGDQGPNTGGMGAYAPLPWLAERYGSVDAFVDQVVDTIGMPVVRQLDREGTPFVGLLYCGLIVTDSSIRVIEFNARFGDPESQSVLPLLVTPLSELLLATATGSLERMPRPEFSGDVAVTVVLASDGYPQSPVVGTPIFGLDEAAAVPGVHLDFGGVGTPPNGSDAGMELVSAGGRVLCVTALAPSVADARARAYEAMGHLRLDGGHFRRDIAAKG